MVNSVQREILCVHIGLRPNMREEMKVYKQYSVDENHKMAKFITWL